MTSLPALARPTARASATPILDQSPHRWLAVAAPGHHDRLPTVAEEVELRRELVAANAPIALDALQLAVARMVAAYPQKGPADVRGYILAVAEHLGEYPVDAVEATCREIVRSCKWLPTIAELVEIADRRVERRRFALQALGMVQAERERRRLAEEQEREHREAAARWKAAGDRARERLNAALATVDPARLMDAGWYRLNATKRIALTCAAQQGDDALDAAIAELIAEAAEIADDSGIPF